MIQPCSSQPSAPGKVNSSGCASSNSARSAALSWVSRWRSTAPWPLPPAQRRPAGRGRRAGGIGDGQRERAAGVDPARSRRCGVAVRHPAWQEIASGARGVDVRRATHRAGEEDILRPSGDQASCAHRGRAHVVKAGVLTGGHEICGEQAMLAWRDWSGTTQRSACPTLCRRAPERKAIVLPSGDHVGAWQRERFVRSGASARRCPDRASRRRRRASSSDRRCDRRRRRACVPSGDQSGMPSS